MTTHEASHDHDDDIGPLEPEPTPECLAMIHDIGERAAFERRLETLLGSAAERIEFPAAGVHQKLGDATLLWRLEDDRGAVLAHGMTAPDGVLDVSIEDLPETVQERVRDGERFVVAALPVRRASEPIPFPGVSVVLRWRPDAWRFDSARAERGGLVLEAEQRRDAILFTVVAVDPARSGLEPLPETFGAASGFALVCIEIRLGNRQPTRLLAPLRAETAGASAKLALPVGPIIAPAMPRRTMAASRGAGEPAVPALKVAAEPWPVEEVERSLGEDRSLRDVLGASHEATRERDARRALEELRRRARW
jgi:hypothetical protein